MLTLLIASIWPVKSSHCGRDLKATGATSTLAAGGGAGCDWAGVQACSPEERASARAAAVSVRRMGKLRGGPDSLGGHTFHTDRYISRCCAASRLILYRTIFIRKGTET